MAGLGEAGPNLEVGLCGSGMMLLQYLEPRSFASSRTV
jgi:hypothetical protein